MDKRKITKQAVPSFNWKGHKFPKLGIQIRVLLELLDKNKNKNYGKNYRHR